MCEMGTSLSFPPFIASIYLPASVTWPLIGSLTPCASSVSAISFNTIYLYAFFPFSLFFFFSKKIPLLRNNLGKKHSSSEGIKYRGGQVDPLPISRYEYLTSQRSLSTESRENKSHPFSASHPSSTMSPVGMWELCLYVFPCFFCTRYLVCYFTHLLTYS